MNRILGWIGGMVVCIAYITIFDPPLWACPLIGVVCGFGGVAVGALFDD